MHPPSILVAISQVQSFDLVSRILNLLSWDEAQLETCDVERHQETRRKILTWQLMVGKIAHALLMVCLLVAQERLAVVAEAGGEVQAAVVVRST